VSDGLTFVAPYDDPHTIAGQGTIGDEILRQVGGRGEWQDKGHCVMAGNHIVWRVWSVVQAPWLTPEVCRRTRFFRVQQEVATCLLTNSSWR